MIPNACSLTIKDKKRFLYFLRGLNLNYGVLSKISPLPQRGLAATKSNAKPVGGDADPSGLFDVGVRFIPTRSLSGLAGSDGRV